MSAYTQLIQEGKQIGKQIGKQEGRQERNYEFAEMMLKNEEPIEKILLYTGVSKEVLDQLRDA